MITLIRPSLTVDKVIDTCISNYLDMDLKNRFCNCKSLFIDEEKKYDSMAKIGTIYQNDEHNEINFNGHTITKNEMKKLYENKLVKKDQPGREIYDELLNSAPLDICPYCMQRTVATLDHFLPKSEFPVFAVTPINLVPSCRDCNTDKLIAFPSSVYEESLHPYYDDVSKIKWLHAKIIRSIPISFEFYVNVPKSVGIDIAIKIFNHFYSFNLDKLYSTHAAVEYLNIKSILDDIRATGGVSEVENHLKLQTKGRNGYNLNSWQSAMYKAMSSDYWFIHYGY